MGLLSMLAGGKMASIIVAGTLGMAVPIEPTFLVMSDWTTTTSFAASSCIFFSVLPLCLHRSQRAAMAMMMAMSVSTSRLLTS